MISANGVAIISLAIVSIVSALSLFGVILSIGELYKAKDLKHKIINIVCLVIPLAILWILLTSDFIP